MRTLRSKRLRHALWRAADGRCHLCGIELGTDWHADHITPWSLTGRTNVHEMQALCPGCNGRKGATVNLRKHQKQLSDVCGEILDGGAIKRIVIEAAPAAGKSLLPQILAARLIPHVADKLCWVVPRLALKVQGAGDFMSTDARQMVGHKLSLRDAGNDRDPSRGHAGYVTTYQAIATWPDLHAQEMDAHRYILVLDEAHHVADGGSWHHALRPMVEKASLVVLMSGMLERGEGGKIAFLPYRQVRRGQSLGWEPALDGADETTASISYSLIDSMRDGAVIRTHFMWADGRVEWCKNGNSMTVGSLRDADKDDVSAAIFSALKTSYAYTLLERCLDSWRRHKTGVYHGAKMLVVAPDISTAKEYLRWLHSRSVKADIATSADSEAAMSSIDAFKRNRGGTDVLVTVAMAYEGLNAREITHLACLTHIRSRPWIYQMLGRGWRFDPAAGPYDRQVFQAYVPDDSLMRECVSEIESATSAFVAEKVGVAAGCGGGYTPQSITPIESEATGMRAAELNGLALSYDDTEALQDAILRNGVSATPIQIKRILDEMQSRGAAPEHRETHQTPGQRETRLRSLIEEFARKVDYKVHAKSRPELLKSARGTTNKLLMKEFRKPRSEMAEAELIRAHQWLVTNYGALVR